MSDRFVIIIVSLLTLAAMCGLFLMAVVWVPSRIDKLDERLSRIDQLGARLDRIQVQIDKLGVLEERLSSTAEAIAPLARVDRTLDGITQKLDKSVVPGVNDLKGRVASRSDVDRLAAEIAKVAKQTQPRDDAALKNLGKDVAALKAQLDGVRKSLGGIQSIGKDVKALSLEIQKLQALVKKPSP